MSVEMTKLFGYFLGFKQPLPESTGSPTGDEPTEDPTTQADPSAEEDDDGGGGGDATRPAAPTPPTAGGTTTGAPATGATTTGKPAPEQPAGVPTNYADKVLSPDQKLDQLAHQVSYAIGMHENSGMPGRYRVVNGINATGRYQFTRNTLLEDSQRFLGYPIDLDNPAQLAQFRDDPSLQDQVMFLKTRKALQDTLDDNDGDIAAAIHDTAILHYGNNGGKLDAPAVSKARDKHGKRIVAESPNEYARKVLSFMPSYNGTLTQSPPTSKDGSVNADALAQSLGPEIEQTYKKYSVLLQNLGLATPSTSPASANEAANVPIYSLASYLKAKYPTESEPTVERPEDHVDPTSSASNLTTIIDSNAAAEQQRLRPAQAQSKPIAVTSFLGTEGGLIGAIEEHISGKLATIASGAAAERADAFRSLKGESDSDRAAEAQRATPIRSILERPTEADMLTARDVAAKAGISYQAQDLQAGKADAFRSLKGESNSDRAETNADTQNRADAFRSLKGESNSDRAETNADTQNLAHVQEDLSAIVSGQSPEVGATGTAAALDFLATTGESGRVVASSVYKGANLFNILSNVPAIKDVYNSRVASTEPLSLAGQIISGQVSGIGKFTAETAVLGGLGEAFGVALSSGANATTTIALGNTVDYLGGSKSFKDAAIETATGAALMKVLPIMSSLAASNTQGTVGTERALRSLLFGAAGTAQYVTDQTLEGKDIDPLQAAIAGSSMGVFGALEANHPEVAETAPVAATGEARVQELAKEYPQTPVEKIRAIIAQNESDHSGSDDNIPVGAEREDMIQLTAKNMGLPVEDVRKIYAKLLDKQTPKSAEAQPTAEVVDEKPLSKGAIKTTGVNVKRTEQPVQAAQEQATQEQPIQGQPIQEAPTQEQPVQEGAAASDVIGKTASSEPSGQVAEQTPESNANTVDALFATKGTGEKAPEQTPIIRSGADLAKHLTEKLGLPPEQAEAVSAIADARANSWAAQNNASPGDWYTSHIASVESGGESGEGALTQSADGTARASVQFLDDGRAVIRGLQSPDVSSAVHELGHVFRRDLSGAELETAEKWAGVKDGKWETPHEEKFARGFERYMRDGKAPTEALRSVFAKFKDWLSGIYQRIKGSAIDVKISPEMRNVFDSLFKGGKEAEGEEAQSSGDALTRLAEERNSQSNDVPAGTAITLHSVGESSTVEPATSRADAFPVRYALVEADDVQTSHDPFSFAKNPKYPSVNQNDYSRSKSAQAIVMDGGDALKFPVLHSQTTSPTEGPSIIDPNGNVAGGNSRAMMEKRAYDGDADSVKAQVVKDASRFGLDPEIASKMDQPMIVRVQDDVLNSSKQSLKRISDLNASGTKERDPMVDGIALASRLTEDAKRTIHSVLDDAATIHEAGQNPAKATQLKRMLEDAGLITSANSDAYYDAKNRTLTDRGEKAIEGLIMGSALKDSTLIEALPDKWKAAIQRSFIDFARAQTVKGWDLTENLKRVIEYNRARQAYVAAGGQSEAFDRQESLLGDKPTLTSEDRTLYDALSGNPNDFKKFISAYAEAASKDGQFDLVSGEVTREKTFESLARVSAKAEAKSKGVKSKGAEPKVKPVAKTDVVPTADAPTTEPPAAEPPSVPPSTETPGTEQSADGEEGKPQKGSTAGVLYDVSSVPYLAGKMMLEGGVYAGKAMEDAVKEFMRQSVKPTIENAKGILEEIGNQTGMRTGDKDAKLVKLHFRAAMAREVRNREIEMNSPDWKATRNDIRKMPQKIIDRFQADLFDHKPVVKGDKRYEHKGVDYSQRLQKAQDYILRIDKAAGERTNAIWGEANDVYGHDRTAISMREGHFPGIFKSSEGLVSKIINRGSGSRNSLGGAQNFRKQRTGLTYAEHQEAGREFAHSHPLDTEADYQYQTGTLNVAVDAVSKLVRAGAIKAYYGNEEAPEGHVPIAGRLGDVYRKVEKPANNPVGDPRLFDLLIKVIEMTGKVAKIESGPTAPTATVTEKGKLYASKEVAKVIENFTSSADPGLLNHALSGVRSITRISNAIQLIGPAHAGIISTVAIGDQAARGLDQMIHSNTKHELVDAIVNMAKGAVTFATSPVAIAPEVLLGHKVLNEYYHPGSESADIRKMVEDYVINAGGRGMPSREMTDRHINEAFAAIRKHNPLLAPYHAVMGAASTVGIPISRWFVPRAKLGAAVLNGLEWDRSHPDATPLERTIALAKNWDSMDDRFGIVTYENWFMNTNAKNVMFAGVARPGWWLGLWKAAYGGLVDTGAALNNVAHLRKPNITNRMTYAAVGIGIADAITNAAIQLLYGHFKEKGPPAPWDSTTPFQDLFLGGRTGDVNYDETPIRKSVINYGVDAVRYYKNLPAGIRNSMSQPLQVMSDIINNKDFAGRQIHDITHGTWYDKAFDAKARLQDIDFALKNMFEPLSLINLLEGRKTSKGAADIVLPWFGVRNTSREITMSPAQLAQSQINDDARAAEGTSRATADKREAEARVRQAFLKGGRADAEAEGTASSDVLSRDDVKKAIKDAMRNDAIPGFPGFKRDSPENALEVFEKATPDQRSEKMRKALDAKIRGRVRPESQTQAEFDRLTARYNALTGITVSGGNQGSQGRSYSTPRHY